LKLLGKRLLILSILIAAFAIGSNLWQEAIPKVNPPPTAAEWKLSAPLDCVRASKAAPRRYSLCTGWHLGPRCELLCDGWANHLHVHVGLFVYNLGNNILAPRL
jgi:hypothetical protein